MITSNSNIIPSLYGIDSCIYRVARYLSERGAEEGKWRGQISEKVSITLKINAIKNENITVRHSRKIKDANNW